MSSPPLVCSPCCLSASWSNLFSIASLGFDLACRHRRSERRAWTLLLVATLTAVGLEVVPPNRRVRVFAGVGRAAGSEATATARVGALIVGNDRGSCSPIAVCLESLPDTRIGVARRSLTFSSRSTWWRCGFFGARGVHRSACRRRSAVECDQSGS